MAQFEPQKGEIERLGASLVYIAAEKREGLWKPQKYFGEHPVAFPFLLDENRSVTKAYGLYHALGASAFRIAHPATVIVDGGGIVRYLYRGNSQVDRVPLEEVMAELGRIQGIA